MRRRVVITDNVKPQDKRERIVPENQELRDQAQKYVDSGMPYQMAMSVVHGRMDLNEALERLARRDRVNTLIERHELSRALATQVAIGHADLDQILFRRRLKAHRVDFRDRTCLEPEADITFARIGGDHTRVTVGDVTMYSVMLQPPKGEAEEVHKLQLKYGYVPAAWKKIRKLVKNVKKSDENTPAERPQDRYTCSDKRLFGYVDKERLVVTTLIDGDVLKGVVTWFSRYEYGLRMKGDVEVTVFRHALQELTPG